MMGGASRNERKRRQEAAQQRLADAGIRAPGSGGPNRTTLVVVAAVVAVAVAIGVTVLLVRGGGDTAPDTRVAVPVTREGAVVSAGSGPVVVDVYGDYLCPFCERAEDRYGSELATAVNDGRVTVRHHLVAILDRLSEPQGYSTRAADAALCAVDAGIYPAYHARLYAEQPAEGGPGLSDEELTAFGTELGAPATFGQCVAGTTNDAAIRDETERAAADPALQGPQGFGTPVYTVNGQRVDLGDTNWLQAALGG